MGAPMISRHPAPPRHPQSDEEGDTAGLDAAAAERVKELEEALAAAEARAGEGEDQIK